MFQFGHMSEWWWRLTRFSPGKAPLLPLDIQQKSKSNDIYTPLNSQGHAETLSTEVSIPAVQVTSDEDRLSTIISAGVATAVCSLKNDIKEIIAAKVVALCC